MSGVRTTDRGAVDVSFLRFALASKLQFRDCAEGTARIQLGAEIAHIQALIAEQLVIASFPKPGSEENF